MWNRSFRWQKETRVVAGAVTLLGVCAALAMISRTPPATRAREGAYDLLAEVSPSGEQTIDVDVPADLHARVGTLVYSERAGGVVQIAGRVAAIGQVEPGRVALQIRLTAPLASGQGGVLKGAGATLDLRAALRLLVSPDTVDKEFEIARNAIWPSVQANVLPDLMDRLVQETVNEFAAPDPQDVELLAKSLQSLRATLEPLEGELVDRLTKRAWDVVGISGLATGVWRSTSKGVQNNGLVVTDWLWNLMGRETEKNLVERPFFSPEMTERLEAALEEETLTFWAEHRSTILAALTKVASERQPDFEAAFRDRWGTLLYERAIMPAWQSGQEKVLESVQDYATDFAARRLLTQEGGPRLLLAYVLRSSLQISDDPLLVLAANANHDAGQVVYEPFLR